jgi:hypothetical protein
VPLSLARATQTLSCPASHSRAGHRPHRGWTATREPRPRGQHLRRARARARGRRGGLVGDRENYPAIIIYFIARNSPLRRSRVSPKPSMLAKATHEFVRTLPYLSTHPPKVTSHRSKTGRTLRPCDVIHFFFLRMSRISGGENDTPNIEAFLSRYKVYSVRVQNTPEKRQKW